MFESAIEHFYKVLAENQLIFGDGLIYEFATDPQYENENAINGIRSEIVSDMPEWVQKLMDEPTPISNHA